jgi:hypothetical protein
VVTGASDPDPGEDPHEQAFASARLVNHELMWCDLYLQTVQENDFPEQLQSARPGRRPGCVFSNLYFQGEIQASGGCRMRNAGQAETLHINSLCTY